MRINPPIAQTRDKVNYAGTSTGSANTQLLSGVTAYQDGMIIEFQSGYTNTDAMQINAKAVQIDGVALVAGQVHKNELLRMRYDAGTDTLQLLRQRVDLGPLFTNAIIRSYQVLNAPSGDNDFGPVPSKKRWWMGAGERHINSSAGAITHYWGLVRGGTVYRSTVAASVAAGGLSATATFLVPIAEEADYYRCNTTASGNCFVSVSIIEFDASSLLKSSHKLGLATGDNTIYTCPPDCWAWIPPVNTFGHLPFTELVSNFSGVTVNVRLNSLVRSGQSPAALGLGSNYYTNANRTNGQIAGSGLIQCSYGPGDYFNTTCDIGHALVAQFLHVIQGAL